jgi:hypothetical protein
MDSIPKHWIISSSEGGLLHLVLTDNMAEHWAMLYASTRLNWSLSWLEYHFFAFCFGVERGMKHNWLVGEKLTDLEVFMMVKDLIHVEIRW